TPWRFSVPVADSSQVKPFQWKVRAPATHTSDGPVPQTALRPPGDSGVEVQPPPFQCSTPPDPATQTSGAPLAQTSTRSHEVPLGDGVQAAPSKCRIVPPAPTAHTSELVVAHT